MAYSRYEKGKSDLYIIGRENGGWECMGCKLHAPRKVYSKPHGRYVLYTPSSYGDGLGDLIDHYYDHKDAGHNVDKEDVKRATAEMLGVPYTHPDDILRDLCERLSAPRLVISQLLRDADAIEWVAEMEESDEWWDGIYAALPDWYEG